MDDRHIVPPCLFFFSFAFFCESMVISNFKKFKVSYETIVLFFTFLYYYLLWNEFVHILMYKSSWFVEFKDETYFIMRGKWSVYSYSFQFTFLCTVSLISQSFICWCHSDRGAKLLEMHARLEDRNAIFRHHILPTHAVHNLPSSCEAEVTCCVSDKGKWPRWWITQCIFRCLDAQQEHTSRSEWCIAVYQVKFY